MCLLFWAFGFMQVHGLTFEEIGTHSIARSFISKKLLVLLFSMDQLLLIVRPQFVFGCCGVWVTPRSDTYSDTFSITMQAMHTVAKCLLVLIKLLSPMLYFHLILSHLFQSMLQVQSSQQQEIFLLLNLFGSLEPVVFFTMQSSYWAS